MSGSGWVVHSATACCSRPALLLTGAAAQGAGSPISSSGKSGEVPATVWIWRLFLVYTMFLKRHVGRGRVSKWSPAYDWFRAKRSHGVAGYRTQWRWHPAAISNCPGSPCSTSPPLPSSRPHARTPARRTRRLLSGPHELARHSPNRLGKNQLGNPCT